MIGVQLHLWLGVAGGLIAALVGLEGAWRAWRRSPPGVLASRFGGLLLVTLIVTGAGGFGLLVGGARPNEALHYVYAIIGLGVMPLATSLGRQTTPRRQGIASLLGALVAVVVIVRLFQTG